MERGARDEDGSSASSLVPRSTSLEIALFAGEYSGDVQGSALATALNEQWAVGSGQWAVRTDGGTNCPLNLWGIGGGRMRAAGVDLQYDSTHWGAMGTYEALKLAPRLLWVISRVKRELLRRPPDMVVLIDFGAFNARLAAWAHAQGLRVFYYFPPGSWRRGPVRPGPRSLPAITHRIATPFPWSETALREAGADAHFVGHPLLDIARPSMTPEEFRRLHQIPAGARIVCHLPGSRRHELRYNWPAMRDAAAKLSLQVPGLAHVLALAPSVQDGLGDAPADVVAASDAGRTPDITRLRSPATVYDALAASDLAITKSGTVTLEAAILGCPMVILYRGSLIQEVEYHLLHRSRIRFMGMPNIILDRLVFPELIQRQASPEGIAAAALPLLNNPAARAEALAALQSVRASLGEPGAIEKTARLILDMAAPTTSSCAQWSGSPAKAER
jgi:lipid-A-disaccharide synthase